MQQILIREDVLEIKFLHAQEPVKNKLIQIPSFVLERIIMDWVEKLPEGARVKLDLDA